MPNEITVAADGGDISVAYFTSAKDVMFLPVSVRLFVRKEDHVKSVEAIFTKPCIGSWSSVMGRTR